MAGESGQNWTLHALQRSLAQVLEDFRGAPGVPSQMQTEQRIGAGVSQRALHDLGHSFPPNAVAIQVNPQNPLVGVHQLANPFAAHSGVFVTTQVEQKQTSIRDAVAVRKLLRRLLLALAFVVDAVSLRIQAQCRVPVELVLGRLLRPDDAGQVGQGVITQGTVL